jgi:hypothetical protein
MNAAGSMLLTVAVDILYSWDHEEENSAVRLTFERGSA